MTTDPFDDLGVPATPVTPRPAFAAALRRRLQDELFPTINVPTRSRRMTSTEPTTSPEIEVGSTQRLIPYLCCRDAAAALEFYTSALGGTEESRMVGDDGRVGHAELVIHGSRIMLADEHPEIDVFSPQHYGGTAVSLHLVVDDVDAVYARATAAGAVGERAPVDEFYGSRAAIIRDPFGHRWFLQTPIEQVASPEMGRRAAEQGYALVEPPATPAAAAVDATVGSEPIEVGYLTFATTDTARAARFFGSLFGWELEQGSSGEGYAHIGNTKLPMGLTPAGVGEAPTPYFRVPSLREFTARVRELGGIIESTDVYESGGSATCRDDQGMTFMLWEPAPGY